MDITIPDYKIGAKVIFPKSDKIIYSESDKRLRLDIVHNDYAAFGENAVIYILDDGVFDHDNMSGDHSRMFYGPFGSAQGEHGGMVKSCIAMQGRQVMTFAPKAEVRIKKFIGESGSFDDHNNAIRDVIKEIKADRNSGLDKQYYLNGSFGAPGSYNNVESNNLYKELKKIGVKCSISSGNESTNTGYPARLDEVFAIAAIEHDNDHAPFSNSGQDVDFGMYGDQVLVASPDGVGYNRASGTSFSAPKFTGALVLVDECFYRKFGFYPSFEQSYSIFKFYALDLADEGFDIKTGHGLATLDSIFDNFNSWAIANGLYEEEEELVCDPISSEDQDILNTWSRLPTFLQSLLKKWAGNLAIVFLFAYSAHAQEVTTGDYWVENNGQHYKQKKQEHTAYELEFLRYYNDLGITTKIASPIQWFGIVKDFLQTKWFQDVISFINPKSNEEKLAMQIGYMVIDKVESEEIDIDIPLSQIIKNFKE